jgi:hypothetical protein
MSAYVAVDHNRAILARDCPPRQLLVARGTVWRFLVNRSLLCWRSWRRRAHRGRTAGFVAVAGSIIASVTPPLITSAPLRSRPSWISRQVTTSRSTATSYPARGPNSKSGRRRISCRTKIPLRPRLVGAPREGDQLFRMKTTIDSNRWLVRIRVSRGSIAHVAAHGWYPDAFSIASSTPSFLASTRTRLHTGCSRSPRVLSRCRQPQAARQKDGLLMEDCD